jgi:hypothetical protein
VDLLAFPPAIVFMLIMYWLTWRALKGCGEGATEGEREGWCLRTGSGQRFEYYQIPYAFV